MLHWMDSVKIAVGIALGGVAASMISALAHFFK
mgnify:FL=1